jgi:hypothetical protein
MAITLIPGNIAGMVFYPDGYRATRRRFLCLLAWADAGVPPRDPQGEELTPGTDVNILAVYARNDHARRVVAGLAAEMPLLSGLWQQVDRALADVPGLGEACTRLTAELAGTRADRANLVAAFRAALAASAEGEDDPLFYLRDELAGQQDLPHPPGGDHDDA